MIQPIKAPIPRLGNARPTIPPLQPYYLIKGVLGFVSTIKRKACVIARRSEIVKHVMEQDSILIGDGSDMTKRRSDWNCLKGVSNCFVWTL